MPISNKTNQATAEQRFRDAFERLKLSIPNILPKGTPVSQNNVAKEAGCDTSALRKARFPLLIMEIQDWVAKHKGEQAESAQQKQLKQRRKNRDNREMIADLKRQRDVTAGLLADANLRIVELTNELDLAQAKIRQLQQSATVHDLHNGFVP